MKSAVILLVDDEEATTFGYSRYLSKQGYITKIAQSLHGAKEMVQAEHFDAILLDLRLPDGNAVDWIKELRSAHDDTAIIVISGMSDIATAVKSMKYGAYNFLTKPVDMDELNLQLSKSLELEALRKRNSIHQRLEQKRSEPFFGSSPAIQKIIEYATVAAMNNTVVLLLGETGTGKGVLARWIHDHSSRKDEAYVELNCSSLRGELLRSELYGHTRGAFTSAVRDREGLIEIADGGTLFLDEIGDMDLEVQAELLKTIEEKTFRRIGENKVRMSDFRLICATNQNLGETSKNGAFRQDLYYRICVFPITISPLRDRKRDIPDLAKNILESFGYNAFPLDPQVASVLTRYPWPGNIRELRNAIERALLLSQGNPLATIHFPGLEGSHAPLIEETSETWNLDEMERNHILKALKYFKGDKYKTSSALGMSLSSLYRRLDSIQNPMATAN